MALQILVAGVASVLIYLVMRGLRLAISSRSWPCTNGKIISSELEEGSDYNIGSGPTYRARIRYRYVVEGTACESTRLWFQHRWFSGRKLTAETIRAGYPVGKAVTVHYDPRRPRIAVLETGISFENVAHLGLSLFFGWVVSTLLDLGLLTVLWMLGLAIAVRGRPPLRGTKHGQRPCRPGPAPVHHARAGRTRAYWLFGHDLWARRRDQRIRLLCDDLMGRADDVAALRRVALFCCGARFAGSLQQR